VAAERAFLRLSAGCLQSLSFRHGLNTSPMCRPQEYCLPALESASWHISTPRYGLLKGHFGPFVKVLNVWPISRRNSKPSRPLRYRMKPLGTPHPTGHMGSPDPQGYTVGGTIKFWSDSHPPHTAAQPKAQSMTAPHPWRPRVCAISPCPPP
jgi:hypothetical protein